MRVTTNLTGKPGMAASPKLARGAAFRLVAVVGLAAATAGIGLAAPGCSKDGKGKTTGAVKTALSVFPREVDVVVGFNPPKIGKSELFELFEPMAARQVGSDYETFKGACGKDPFELAQTVVMGVDIQTGRGFVVVQGVNRDTFVRCGEGLAKAKGERVLFNHEGKVTKIVSGAATNYVAWIDDRTFLLGRDLSGEQLLERVAGKDGLDGNKDLMSLLGEVDSRASIWVVGTPGEPIAVREAGIQADLSAGFATIGLGGGLKIEAGIRAANSGQAAETADKIKAFTGLAKLQFPQLSSLELSAVDRDIVVKLNMSKADIEGLINKIQNDSMMREVIEGQIGELLMGLQ